MPKGAGRTRDRARGSGRSSPEPTPAPVPVAPSPGLKNITDALKSTVSTGGDTESRPAPSTPSNPETKSKSKPKPAPVAPTNAALGRPSFVRPGRDGAGAAPARPFVGVKSGAFDPRQRSQEAQEAATRNLGGSTGVSADPGLLPTGFNPKKFEEDQRALTSVGFSSGQ